MATSTSSHSLVKTESTRPPTSTSSAGSSPRATAIHFASMTVKILQPALAKARDGMAGAEGFEPSALGFGVIGRFDQRYFIPDVEFHLMARVSRRHGNTDKWSATSPTWKGLRGVFPALR